MFYWFSESRLPKVSVSRRRNVHSGKDVLLGVLRRRQGQSRNKNTFESCMRFLCECCHFVSRSSTNIYIYIYIYIFGEAIPLRLRGGSLADQFSRCSRLRVNTEGFEDLRSRSVKKCERVAATFIILCLQGPMWRWCWLRLSLAVPLRHRGVSVGSVLAPFWLRSGSVLAPF